MNFVRIDYTSARPGSAKAIFWMAVFVALRFLFPGIFERRLECQLCGRQVEESNAYDHLRYFHPEEKI